MSGLLRRWDNLGLRLKLQILIQGFIFILLVVTQHWLFLQFEHQTLKAAEDRITAVADGAINGLNTLMLTKSGDSDVISDPASRALFVEKMGASDHVLELRVVRAKSLNDEFGPGLSQEQPVDAMDQSVLASGKSEIKLLQTPQGGTTLRAVLPFIAMKNFRKNNCLSCHAADEGTVLGAASIVVDINDDIALLEKMKWGLWAGQAVLQIVLFFVIGLIVKKSLRQLGGEPHLAANAARRVAGGDLSQTLSVNPGDSDSLMVALNVMQSSLADVVRRVRHGAENLSMASVEIAQGNLDLSARTEDQAGALQKTAVAMVQLGLTVKRNAQDSQEASHLAKVASDVAEKGGSMVAQVVETMKGINASSHQIGNIVSVIDGIAFQTNILALNAAVEAARAGETGRGFAVVANEVRSLAGRSADAAKEIKNLIASSVLRVEQGAAEVDATGVTMSEVVSSIQDVTHIMTKISAASEVQASDVAQIEAAVTHMDQVTQQNAALVEEMAAAAVGLKSQAHELLQVVETFNLPAKGRP